LYFELLQNRLLQALRLRLRNGELTERSLARLTGISQPHVHNVLKGARILSPEIADIVLKSLGLSIFDLIETDEFEAAMSARNVVRSFARVPFLAGLVGPGHPWPSSVAIGENFWVCGPEARKANHFAAVRLAPDTEVTIAAGGGGVALLDVSEAARIAPDPNAYYALACSSESLIRRIRPTNNGIFVFSDQDAQIQENWIRVSHSGAPTEIIRGKVLTVLPTDSDPLALQPLRFLGLDISR
jgi:hypothetical protein